VVAVAHLDVPAVRAVRVVVIGVGGVLGGGHGLLPVVDDGRDREPDEGRRSWCGWRDGLRGAPRPTPRGAGS
jgi:hypothetical protein